MIQFHQFAWSPYCLVTRRILDYGRIPYRALHVRVDDRSPIWKLTRERYYQVPVIQDGKQVLFETGPDTQVIAKYLDSKFGLGLFPAEWEGVQDVLWRYFENDVESVTFRLNDARWREFVPASERCGYQRHKERRFGAGCLEEWLAGSAGLVERLEGLLGPAERMLEQRPYLLGDRPLFVDFSLHGMVSNFLYSGHYQIPGSLPCLAAWHERLGRLRRPATPARGRGGSRHPA